MGNSMSLIVSQLAASPFGPEAAAEANSNAVISNELLLEMCCDTTQQPLNCLLSAHTAAEYESYSRRKDSYVFVAYERQAIT